LVRIMAPVLYLGAGSRTPLMLFAVRHPPGWVLVAEPAATSGHRRMWITPARTREEAERDLGELATYLASGRPVSDFGAPGATG